MKKNRFTPILLTLLLTLLVATPAFAKTVCKIGSKGYSSLQAAVDAVKDGKTIKVTKAIKAKNRVEVPAGKRFTIDFAKKKYTCEKDITAFGVGPNSNVTIKNAKIEVLTTAFDVAGKNGDPSTLTFMSGTVKAGRIQVNGTMNIKGGSFTFNVKNYDENYNDAFIQVADTGTLNISKGTFLKAENPWGQIIENNGGKVNITNGTFTAQGGILISKGNAVTVIKNGQFARTTTPQAIISAQDKSTIKVKGGNFKGGFYSIGGKFIITGGKSNGQVIVTDNGKATVSGLTINQDDPSILNVRLGGPMLVNIDGTLIVKSGTFISPNGIGYTGDVTFKVSGDYRNLFQVKTLYRPYN